ncbi:MAG: SusD/RagB family nutrient-binding outer membrane lipoprotein [Alistipes sp.]
MERDDSALFRAGDHYDHQPARKIWNGYSDTRMGADGLLPQRLQRPASSGLFSVTEGDNKGEYRGVANGMPNPSRMITRPVRAQRTGEIHRSTLALDDGPEVAFLRAEGAMRGWTAEMGGTAEEFYNKGIELSFLETPGVIAAYAADETANRPTSPTFRPIPSIIFRPWARLRSNGTPALPKRAA